MKKKLFKITFSYNYIIEAENEKEATDDAIDMYNDEAPTLDEMNISDPKEVFEKGLSVKLAQNMKYKVGDRVKIIKCDIRDYHDECIGQSGIIIEAELDWQYPYALKNIPSVWSAEELKLIKKGSNKPMKYILIIEECDDGNIEEGQMFETLKDLEEWVDENKDNFDLDDCRVFKVNNEAKIKEVKVEIVFEKKEKNKKKKKKGK